MWLPYFAFCPTNIFLTKKLKARQKRGDWTLQNLQLFSIDNQTKSAFAAFFIGELMQRGVHRFPRGTRTEKPNSE